MKKVVLSSLLILILMNSQAQKQKKVESTKQVETQITDSTEFIAIIDIKNTLALVEKEMETKMTLKEFKEIQKYFNNIILFASARKQKQ